jgi:hypothetical protein
MEKEQIMETHKKFWAVWRNTGGSAPSKRHDTKEEALLEAQRLATQTQTDYYVLEVIGVVGPIVMPVTFTEI